MNKIVVTGAIVSRNGVTLFTRDGGSQVFPQESWKTAALLNATMIPLAQQPDQGVEIDLDEFRVGNLLAEATAGAVKLTESVSGLTIETASGAKIENAEKLMPAIERAIFGEGAKGFAAFIADFAKIKHEHTEKELLAYMEKNDLPIADDGSILVYKYLSSTADPDVFVDTHTRSVKQRLGSYVSMPAELVNRSRREECSTGLHVCSNRYGSYGNVVFIAKVWPRDVIAVPLSYGGKMRVAGYHLVGRLPDGAHIDKIATRRPTDHPGARGLIEKILAGNHPAVIETVTIGGSTTNHDTKIEIKPVAGAKTKKSVKGKTKIDAKVEKKIIDPKMVRKVVAAARSGDLSKALNTPSLETSKGQPWEMANVGDKIVVKGSKRVASGTYVVTEVVEDVPGIRVRVDYHGVKTGIRNECVKQILWFDPSVKASFEDLEPTAAEPAPEPAPEPVVDAPKVEKSGEYGAKLDEAQAMFNNGASIRVIAAQLGMCRKALAKNLKR